MSLFDLDDLRKAEEDRSERSSTESGRAESESSFLGRFFARDFSPSGDDDFSDLLLFPTATTSQVGKSRILGGTYCNLFIFME